ncbi:MAG: DUF362 domain-containing protein [Promethearchaeota archaeon]|jgi:UDP-glucose 4-epimerase
MVTREEILILLKKMMKDLEGIAQTDEIYRVDMRDIGIFKINWKVSGVKGYQIFETNNYSYKVGELIDDPDVTISIRDKDLARRFLKCERVDHTETRRYKGHLHFLENTGWKEVDHPEKGKQRIRTVRPFLIARFNKKKKLKPLVLSKFPMFRNFRVRSDEEEYGSYIPVNLSAGEFENEVIPLNIFKHFIDKASHIVVRPCGCRERFKCQDHDISLGCMYLGDDVLQIIDPEPLNDVKVVTKEEALDHVKRAIENGLIPILGRAVGELRGFGKEDTGHNLSCCFCCTCCCINAKVTTYGSVAMPKFYKRMEGLSVEVDPAQCIGCEKCLEVCVFRGMELVDDKVKVNQQFCLGCGRCEGVCPEGAISIKINEPTQINKFVSKVEKYVDVEDQRTKVITEESN